MGFLDQNHIVVVHKLPKGSKLVVPSSLPTKGIHEQGVGVPAGNLENGPTHSASQLGQEVLGAESTIQLRLLLLLCQLLKASNVNAVPVQDSVEELGRGDHRLVQVDLQESAKAFALSHPQSS